MVKKLEVSISIEVHDDLSTLLESEQELMLKAQEATELAYAPYSEFHVGVAVLLNNGQIILGSNQENAAYPSGLCAERVALFHIGSSYRNLKVVAMAVAAKNKDIIEFKAITPCGSCRQVMLEHEQRQQAPFKVLLHGPNGSAITVGSAQDLLPLKFDAESLIN